MEYFVTEGTVSLKQISRWFQYLYFLRFSVLAWLFLIVLVYLDCRTGAAALTRGIMTVESGWQAFFAAFSIVSFQMAVLITARNIVKNGEDRFLSAAPDRLHSVLTSTKRMTMWWVLLFAHIPTCVSLAYLARNAYKEQQTFRLLGQSTHYVWVFLTLGVVAAFLFWYLVSLFYVWTYEPSDVPAAALVFPPDLFGDAAQALKPPRIKWLERLPLSLLTFSLPGYAKNEKGPLWELHFLSILALIGFFLLYLFLFPFTAPVVGNFQVYFAVPLSLITLACVYIVWTADTTGSKWAPRVKRTFQVIPLLLLGLYFLGIALSARNVNGPNLLEMAFPTLASILVLATFSLWLLAGLGFFFDRYRIPVFMVLILAFVLPKKLSAPWSNGEHYYSAEAVNSPVYPPSPKEVLQLRASNVNDPFIIVTASGGGIHAAAWTAQVMSHLEAAFANDQDLKNRAYTFHDHLILASGVSGGSVGLMPYLLEYAATSGPTFRDSDSSLFHARITNPPACSALEAVAWGLEYNDLYRLIFDFIPRLGSGEARDRSWALSSAFHRNLHDPHCFDGGLFPPPDEGRDNLTLAKASDLLRAGRMPAFTFNTTAAETGDRFLLANYEVPPLKSQNVDFVPAQSFLQVYSQETPFKVLDAYADLSMATAARLSATFPYVSSASRLSTAYISHAYHFLDGGYYDNDGTASTIEFLKSALDEPTSGHHWNILLIEIRDGEDLGSQSDDDLSRQNQIATSKWNALSQLAAPPGGLWKAGHSGISRRNRRELCLLESSYQRVLTVHHLVFPISTPTSRLQPLSWNLTANQRKDIYSWANNDETGGRINEALRWVKSALGNEIISAGDADICKTAEVH